MEQLSLFRGRELKLTDKVSIKHYTFSDIEECGYDKYCKYITDIVTEPVDVADILWFDGHVWYEDLKNPWDFFLQRAISNSTPKPVGFIDGDNLIYVEENCLFINEEMRDALNWSEKFELYTLEKDCFKFTEYHYNITKEYLRDINWFHPEYDFVHGGNKRAKKYILKQQYNQRNKKHKETVTLESIVSSLVARGQAYSEVINYPIYVIYNQYYRLIKVDEYQNTLRALYGGCLDTKKNPIQWDKINWSSIIK